jgi:hypothetical protein
VLVVMHDHAQGGFLEKTLYKEAPPVQPALAVLVVVLLVERPCGNANLSNNNLFAFLPYPFVWQCI